jgi:hypothetical protein
MLSSSRAKRQKTPWKALGEMLTSRRQKRKEKPKKQKSSSYATASLLLPPSATQNPPPFSVEETTPSEVDPFTCVDIHHTELDPLDDHPSELDPFTSSVDFHSPTTELDPFTAVDVPDDCDAAEVSASACSTGPVQASKTFNGIHGIRNKGHKISRKRRGYVAYATKKDKNIKLTTVMEGPCDDIESYDDVGMVDDVIDGEMELTI